MRSKKRKTLIGLMTALLITLVFLLYHKVIGISVTWAVIMALLTPWILGLLLFINNYVRSKKVHNG